MMADTGFSVPTLQTIIDRTEAEIATRLPGADARLRRNVLNVLGRVHSGQTHGLYGYQTWIARQIIPYLASAEYLALWAQVWGVSRLPATKASGAVTFTGTNGSVIAAGTEAQRGDGIAYTVTDGGTVASGSVTINVEAAEAGTDGNADAAVTISLISPVTGVTPAGTVGNDGLTGGADEEDDESLLERLLDRIQTPPHGGAESDYVKWAKEVSGVTRAWVYPMELGAGTVTVRFAMDDAYEDGIPLAGDVTEVQAYIDSLRPVTADVTVVAPVATALDIEISGLSPDTPAIRAAIEAELADMLLRLGEPGGTVYLSKIGEAISIATGEDRHTIVTPAANVTHTTGQLPVLGTVTYS